MIRMRYFSKLTASPGILLILLFFAIDTIAQPATFKMQMSSPEIKLKVKNGYLIITDSFNKNNKQYEVTSNNNEYSFINENDAVKIFEDFGIDSKEVLNQFSNAYPSKSAGNVLLSRVATDTSGILFHSDTSLSNTIEEPGGKIILNNKKPTNATWYYIIGAALLSVLIISLLYFYYKKKKKNDNKEQLESAQTEKSEKTKTLNATNSNHINSEAASSKKSVKQPVVDSKKYIGLEKDLKALKTENSNLRKAIETDKRLKSNYFKYVQEELILPFENAVDKNDHSKMLEYLLKMSAHLTSYTRHELGFKQNYDHFNISQLLQNADKTEAPIVTNDTPKDNIPNNIRNIQGLMRESNVESLGDTVILGYKIKK